jgi:hypothetical protein
LSKWMALWRMWRDGTVLWRRRLKFRAGVPKLYRVPWYFSRDDTVCAKIAELKTRNLNLDGGWLIKF